MNALSTEGFSSIDLGDGLLLWIDAVCINQSDITEKSWQVAQMGDVYSGARRTLIFLGPRTEYSDEAVEFFRRIGKELKCFDNITGRGVFPQHIYNVLNMFSRDDPTIADATGVEAIIASVVREANKGEKLTTLTNAIIGCAWWFRTWVSYSSRFMYSLIAQMHSLILC